MTFTLTAVVIALVLTATILLVVRPLYQARNTPEVKISHWVLLLLFPVAVVLIYAQVTTYPWDNPELVEAANRSADGDVDPGVAAIEQMVDGLAARLEQEPDDLQGWEMLGRSYMQLYRYPDAARAWRQAWRLSEGERPDIALNYAESLALSDPESLRGTSGEILDIILEDDPGNAKALWYGGLAAAARGQAELAVERWAALLNDPNLPPNLRQTIQQQLAAIGADVPLTPPATNEPPMFKVTIDIAPELADQVAPGQPLFVFARDAEGARPPVAVKRLSVSEFPVSTTLRDADVMMPGLKLTGLDNLRLVARISLGGSATEASGDLFGEVFPEPLGGTSQKVQITIDQVVP